MLKIEDFEITSRSFKIMGEKAKYDRIGYSDLFFSKMDDGRIYEIEFVPNNYFTVKKLLKQLNYVTMESVVQYDLQRRFSMRANEKDKRLVIRYDDDNETILIDKVPFKVEADEFDTYLVREGDRGRFYFDDYMYKYAK